MMAAPRIEQAVILCGGLGTRLGTLTETLPKPLLPIAGKPFLERLLFEIKRYDLRRILLLAAHMSSEMASFAGETAELFGIDIDVAVEPGRAGTGGAIWHARDRLEENFFLFNGDRRFDFNLLDLAATKPSSAIVSMALRQIANGSRYGTVTIEDDRVTGFKAKGASEGAALINSGVYLLDRRIISYLKPDCSFEHDVLQPLAKSGHLSGHVYDGFFIDIGIPADYERAQIDIPAHQKRGAVFLDRDGVINVDHGHVGEIERFEWMPGVQTSIKALNDRGLFVFIVTNQSGVGNGLYPEENVHMLHRHILRSLAEIGAHIDDFRYCPFHPNASLTAYARVSDWRKPGPGMLLDLMAHWQVNAKRSIMVGDRDTDVEAGIAAGMTAYRLKPGETLSQALGPFLSRLRETESQ